MFNKGNINYVMFLLVFFVCFILFVFGVQSFNALKDKSKIYDLEKFKTDFKKDASHIAREYDSQIFKEYEISDEYYLFCLFDIKHSKDILKSKILRNYPLIINFINGTDNNVVMLGTNNKFEVFNVDGLGIEDFPYYSCLNIDKGLLKIKFLGKGSFITIPYTSKQEMIINSTDSHTLHSTDNVARIELENGKNSLDPAEQIILTLDIKSSGENMASDEYVIGPSGVTFGSNAYFYINLYTLGLIECDESETYTYILDGNPLDQESIDCDSGDLKYSLTNVMIS